MFFLPPKVSLPEIPCHCVICYQNLGAREFHEHVPRPDGWWRDAAFSHTNHAESRRPFFHCRRTASSILGDTVIVTMMFRLIISWRMTDFDSTEFSSVSNWTVQGYHATCRALHRLQRLLAPLKCFRKVPATWHAPRIATTEPSFGVEWCDVCCPVSQVGAFDWQTVEIRRADRTHYPGLQLPAASNSQNS